MNASQEDRYYYQFRYVLIYALIKQLQSHSSVPTKQRVSLNLY